MARTTTTSSAASNCVIVFKGGASCVDAGGSDGREYFTVARASGRARLSVQAQGGTSVKTW